MKLKDKICRFLWVISNGSFDASCSYEIDPFWGNYLRLEISVRKPLFWRRRFCRHERALKTGVVSKDGFTWCLLCDQPVKVKPEVRA